MNPSLFRSTIISLGILAVFATAYYVAFQSTPSETNGAIAWKSFSEGVVLAKTSNKKILVDVYTDWCSWCKKMDVEVYTNKDIVKMIKSQFIAIKLNAESSAPVSYKGINRSEAEFARQLGVTGYPTTLFFDSQSNPITDMPGYAPEENFGKILAYIGGDYYKTISFQAFVAATAPSR